MLMRDYTLLQEAVKLGGKVVTVEGLRRDAGGVPCVPDVGARQRPPLSIGTYSTANIKYVAGARVLTSHRGGRVEVVTRGLRGEIQGFSSASRRRLLTTVLSVRNDASLPLFVTLTYPNEFPDPKTSKRHLATFLKRLDR